MIATTGEMPVNFAETTDLDLSRSTWAGLSDKAAKLIDNKVLEVMLRFRSRGPGEAVITEVSLTAPSHRTPSGLGIAEADAKGRDLHWSTELASVEKVWHQEPEFTPGRVARGIVLGPPDFGGVTDGIEWE